MGCGASINKVFVELDESKIEEQFSYQIKNQCQYPLCTQKHDKDIILKYGISNSKYCHMPECKKKKSRTAFYCEKHVCHHCHFWGGWIPYEDSHICPICKAYINCKILLICKKHMCKFFGCYNIQEIKSKYCSIHTCQNPYCKEKSQGKTYCSKHKCYRRGCFNSNAFGKFCSKHNCQALHCSYGRWNDEFCIVHYS